MGHRRLTGALSALRSPLVINRSDPINNGLGGAWLCNDGGGKVLRDLTGTANGVLVNPTASQWVPGPQFLGGGKALTFNGTSQYATIASTILSSVFNFSFSMWILQPARAGSWTPWFNTSDLTSGFFVGKFTDGAAIGYSGGTTFGVALPPSYPIGQWFHLAVSMSLYVPTPTLTLVKSWINGIGNGRASGSAPTPAETTIQLAGNSASGYYSNCTIANLRVWRRVITVREAQRLYAQPLAGLYVPRRITVRVGASGNSLNAIGIIGPISTVATGQNIPPTLARATLSSISSVITASNPNVASAVATILGLNVPINPWLSSAFSSAFGIYGILATQETPLQASVSALISSVRAVVTGQNPVPASSLSTLGPVTSSVIAGQSDRASTSTLISSISTVATGQNPAPVSATVQIPTITCTATALQGSGSVTLATIGAPTAVVTGQNPVPASSLSTIGLVTSSVIAGQSNRASTSILLSAISAVVTGQNPVPASATVQIPTITCTIAALQGSGSFTLANISNISAVIVAANPYPASILGTIGLVTSTVVAGQSDRASANTLVSTISAVATGQNPIIANASISVPTIACTITALQGSGSFTLATIGAPSAVIVAANPYPASILGTVGPIKAAGIFGQENRLVVTGTISVSAVVTTPDYISASATDTITIVNSNVAAGQAISTTTVAQILQPRCVAFINLTISGNANIATVTAAIVGNQAANGLIATINIPTIGVIATGQNKVNPVIVDISLTYLSARAKVYLIPMGIINSNRVVTLDA